MPEIAEQLFQAVDTIISDRINKISYDTTLTCTIVDDSDKKNGIYQVSNGTAKFTAYSTNTTYIKNDIVYVQIPNGNWDEQKIILSKKPSGQENPIAYEKPFDTYVDITGNMITSNPKQFGLLANNYESSNLHGNIDYITIWSYNNLTGDASYKESGTELGGYTRLGLQASFQAWLYELGAVKGSYGLRLKIEGVPDDEGKLDEDGNEIERETKYYDLYLDSSDMPGNPYNFESYFQQEMVFDVSGISKIRSIDIQFYEVPGSFIDPTGAEIPWKGLAPNIFVKDIYLSLGYDSTSFDTDTIFIYSLDSSQYVATADPAESNHKEVQIRWIHKDEDGKCRAISDKDDLPYVLTWYRKELGHRSDTVYSGVDWKPLSKQSKEVEEDTEYEVVDPDWVEYNQIAMTSTNGVPRLPEFNQTWLIPDVTKSEESVKAILIYDDQPYYSNIITFTNEKEVVSKPTVDAVQALTINCEDESYGNYMIYNKGGTIVDSADAQTRREWKLYFNSTEEEKEGQLAEAESVEWIIPASNTMIVIDDPPTSGYSEDTKDFYVQDGYYHITRYGEKNKKYDVIANSNNIQPYRIAYMYSQTKSNNTVKCNIVRNKVSYSAIKEMTFGPIGTSGTDYTFILDFNNGATALTVNNKDRAVTVRARLYDYEGKEIEGLESREIAWSWQDKGDDPRITLVPQDRANVIELQLKDSVTSVPTNHYSILKATLSKNVSNNDGGWGDYDLIAYLPIPIRADNQYQFISGATTIYYNSLGYLDDMSYYSNPYRIYSQEGMNIYDSTWEVFSSAENEKQKDYVPKMEIGERGYILRPLNIYVEDSIDDVCVVGYVNGQAVWSQPVYIYQNKYPSTLIDNWNGELKIDEKNNAILAAKVVAGKKERDNTFSGVMMGDWSGEDVEGEISQNTGIYGFYHGAASFGFKDDGTAFIGQAGSGRLRFDGEKSTIQSEKYIEELGGMGMDFDEGWIKMQAPGYWNSTEKYIYIDASATSYPFKIGKRFKVDWDGTIYAENGLFKGSVEADFGSFKDLEVTNTIQAANGSFSSLYANELEVDGYFKTNELYADKIYFAQNSLVTTSKKIAYYIRASSDVEWREVSKSTYDSYSGQKKTVTKKGGSSQDKSYKGYLGYFKGADGMWNDTNVVGIRSTESIVLESSGNTIRIGNNSTTDFVILRGTNVRFHSNGIVGTGEGFTHQKFYIKASEITFEGCAAENQHGIYARFA